MKKVVFFLVACFTIATFTLSSCKDEKDPVTPDVVSFKTDIKPIFATNCSTSGCHNTADHKNDLILETHAVIAAKAAGLLKTMNHEDGVKPMPYPPGSDKLDQAVIDKFKKWIAEGKKDN